MEVGHWGGTRTWATRDETRRRERRRSLSRHAEMRRGCHTGAQPGPWPTSRRSTRGPAGPAAGRGEERQGNGNTWAHRSLCKTGTPGREHTGVQGGGPGPRLRWDSAGKTHTDVLLGSTGRSVAGLGRQSQEDSWAWSRSPGEPASQAGWAEGVEKDVGHVGLRGQGSVFPAGSMAGAAPEDVGPRFGGDLGGPTGSPRGGLREASLRAMACVTADRGPAGPPLGGREGGGAPRGGAREAGCPCRSCRALSHPFPVTGQAIWDPEIKPDLQIPSGCLCSWGLRELPVLSASQRVPWAGERARRPPTLNSRGPSEELFTTTGSRGCSLTFPKDPPEPTQPPGPACPCLGQEDTG